VTEVAKLCALKKDRFGSKEEMVCGVYQAAMGKKSKPAFTGSRGRMLLSVEQSVSQMERPDENSGGAFV
jgi:hypothetical protein